MNAEDIRKLRERVEELQLTIDEKVLQLSPHSPYYELELEERQVLRLEVEELMRERNFLQAQIKGWTR